jgi:2-phospho-L-lactate guanylyltransferase
MWHVVVPVKAWDAAKTRLDLPPPQREALAKSMAQDTLENLAACPLVTQISVVTTTPDMVDAPELRPAGQVLVQPEHISNLDQALSWAIGELAINGPSDLATAVIVADLPALTASDLQQVLRTASRHRVSMVVDHHGTGTTLLAATDPLLLAPAFGTASAARHQIRAVTVLGTDQCGPAVRCDVDTLDDLTSARDLGLGRHSRVVDARLGSLAWPKAT